MTWYAWVFIEIYLSSGTVYASRTKLQKMKSAIQLMKSDDSTNMYSVSTIYTLH